MRTTARTISYLTVIALASVVTAAGASSLITGGQIASHTITPRNLGAGILSKLNRPTDTVVSGPAGQQGSQGQQGPQGPVGVAGAQGPPGAQGATGATGGYTSTQIVETDLALTEGVSNGTSYCPAGSYVTGGGFQTGIGVQVLSSIPFGDGWNVVFYEPIVGIGTLRVYAICSGL